MARLRLSLLGPLQITLDEKPLVGFESNKVRALLAYLAVEADRAHQRDALAGLLWPEQPERTARDNLRQALSNLRHVVGDRSASTPLLFVTRESAQFNDKSDAWLDVAEFSQLLERCRRHRHRRTESCARCAAWRREAVALYRADFLAQLFLEESVELEEWVLLKREALHRQAIEALAWLADDAERRGAYREAQPYAWRQVELDPWREEAHRQLMRLLAASGERSAALAQYERCRRSLAEELGVEPTAETTSLYEQIRSGRFVAEPYARPEHNLPGVPSPLIGREEEVRALVVLLEVPDCRLVTLVGPGGIGKTRLALEVASVLARDFADGVFFVPLAPVRDPDLVLDTIAQTLGIRESGGRMLLESVKAHLRTKQSLLVLDNFEHVISAAPLVAELLTGSAGMAALVTSRERLNLRGEHEFPVPPLATPSLKAPVAGRATGPQPEALDSKYPAIRLFLERARAVRSGFALTPENAEAVATICARLDGLPLAIELAAARVRLLPPEQMLARLDKRLSLLTGGPRDLPARQQTLRDTIAWSYNLLEPDEQALFTRLAVFAGGCTAEAVEAVAGYRVKVEGSTFGDQPSTASRPEAVPDRTALHSRSAPKGFNLQPSTLDGLASLVDKHLLAQVGADGDGDGIRFGMLETIREYAVEQLQAGDEAEALHRRHAEYYTALAESAEPQLTGPHQVSWLERLEAEHDNLRAALAWSLRGDEVEIASRLGAALGRFWYMRGHLREGRRWLDAALKMGGALPTAYRANAFSWASWLAWSQGDYGEAVAYAEDCLNAFKQLDDRPGTAVALNTLGNVILYQGEVGRAQRLFEEALAIRRTLGNRRGIAVSLNNLGIVAHYQGDYEQAAALLEESLALFRAIEDSSSIPFPIINLARTALERGDYARAMDLCKESLLLWREQGDKVHIAHCLLVAGRIAAAEGQAERAARLFGAEEGLRESIGSDMDTIDRRSYDESVAAARARLEPRAFASAWREGRATPLEEAIEYVLQCGTTDQNTPVYVGDPDP